MEIRSLENIGEDELALAFAEAFADYATTFTRSQFLAILKRRGYRGDCSFGVFDCGRIVSFVFNGIRDYEGRLTAYDTGTGTIKEHRGKGLTRRLLSHAEEALRAKGVERYLLEVLCDNAPAVALYKKAGFEEVRRFACYSQQVGAVILPEAEPEGVEIIEMPPSQLIGAYEAYGDTAPSWQNSPQSILADEESLVAFGATKAGGELAGCIIADPAQGDIMAIAVRPDQRRRRIGSALLKAFMGANRAPIVKLLNIDTRCATLPPFLRRCAIAPSVAQYEMQRDY